MLIASYSQKSIRQNPIHVDYHPKIHKYKWLLNIPLSAETHLYRITPPSEKEKRKKWSRPHLPLLLQHSESQFQKPGNEKVVKKPKISRQRYCTWASKSQAVRLREKISFAAKPCRQRRMDFPTKNLRYPRRGKYISLALSLVVVCKARTGRSKVVSVTMRLWRLGIRSAGARNWGCKIRNNYKHW